MIVGDCGICRRPVRADDADAVITTCVFVCGACIRAAAERVMRRHRPAGPGGLRT